MEATAARIELLREERQAREQLLALQREDDPDQTATATPDQEAFHRSQAWGRVLSGGNRSGKTWVGTRECMWWLLHRHPFRDTPPPPTYGRIVSPETMQTTRDDPTQPTRSMIRHWLPAWSLKGGAWSKAYSPTANTLWLANGSTVEFMSHEQVTLRQAGVKRHWIMFDEECPREKFDENLMRLVDLAGSWWLTFSPTEGMSWTYNDLYIPWSEGEVPNVDWFTIATADNPAIEASELDALRAVIPEEQLRARLCGEFVAFGGLIYQGYRRDRHIWPAERPLPFKIEDLPVFCIIDPGIGAPTAALWVAADHEGGLWAFDEYYERDRTVAQNAEAIKEIGERHGVKPHYLIDPAARQRSMESGRPLLSLYGECGIHARPAPNAWQPGIDQVRQYLLQGRFVMLSTLRNLQREFLTYRRSERWANNPDDPTGRPLTEGDHHLLDCVRYVCATRPIAPPITRAAAADPALGINLIRKLRQPSDYIRPKGYVHD